MSQETESGFTLLELLVAITIIAILAGVVSPMIFRNVDDAKVSAARTQIEAFGLALDTYYLHCGGYPSTAEGLAVLVTRPDSTACPGWRGPYLKKAVPSDPWGRPYLYLGPGAVNPASYDLSSLGKDGTPGGVDDAADLTSWGDTHP